MDIRRDGSAGFLGEKKNLDAKYQKTAILITPEMDCPKPWRCCGCWPPPPPPSAIAGGAIISLMKLFEEIFYDAKRKAEFLGEWPSSGE